jgi:hypothetical protein
VAVTFYAGPLAFVGVVFAYFGLFRACTGAGRFDTREDVALVALGAAMIAGGCVMWWRAG